MLELSDAEREHLTEMRALSNDSDGREVFVGLTHEETTIFQRYQRDFIAGPLDRNAGDEYLALHEKHEKARLQVLGMEHVLRFQNRPPN